MATLTAALCEGFKGRRSIYQLTNESTISDARIEELLSAVLLHTPSSFNSQSARIVLLLKDDHQKLWDIAREEASATLPPDIYQNLYNPRITLYRAAYGSALFYEDPAPLKAMQEKLPILKDKFPQWSEHSSGMHQYAAWTLFEAEGLGCNLQHYTPILDARISKEWNVPPEWSLKAQLVFGKPVGDGGIREKTFEPLEKRIFVHGR
ncbi:hypothetical protein AJ78_04810 [Emergomyces pasteurianus Ep9510]|uniref:Nitroreductase domain-containing protein n=1 Tax=Emergomyces pasteurianus Ep9510 TaxID=1447872 RepID=A0A1J9PG07_9EURO|nr:hypothetical protein AJ78_04810 [Emergomyces pasteurianus Ep9510]